MTDQDKLIYSFTNKISRIIVNSFEEVIGHNGMKAVLKQAELSSLINSFPDDNESGLKFDELSSIHLSLEQLFGVRGGRGLALRAGRVCFKNELREFGEEYGITDTEFRILPLEKKVTTGMEILANLLNDHSNQQVKARELSDRILWTVEYCSNCWNRKTDSHVCYLNVGMLQEGLFWVSGGKLFYVEETECVAKGDKHCTIAIDKIALN